MSMNSKLKWAAVAILALLLVSVSAGAVDTVYAVGLPGARVRCEAANMSAKVEPNGSVYTVTCVARPDSIVLGHAETYAVQQCRDKGWIVRIEIYARRLAVSCVVRP